MPRWLIGWPILVPALSARAAFALASGDMPELALCGLRTVEADAGDRRLAQNMSKRRDKAKSEDDDEDSADDEEDSSDDESDNDEGRGQRLSRC
jgi:hypothetical protein